MAHSQTYQTMRIQNMSRLEEKKSKVEYGMDTESVCCFISGYIETLKSLLARLCTTGREMSSQELRSIRLVLASQWLPEMLDEIQAAFVSGNFDVLDNQLTTIVGTFERFSATTNLHSKPL
jgi:hypothetical protein